MNALLNIKEEFLKELKKSNIKLSDFCIQKNLNRDVIKKIFNKYIWSCLLTDDERIIYHVIENWIIDKQKDRANREIFDVEQLISKFNKHADKNVIVNMIMTKTTIQLKKIKALIKGCNTFKDLTDDQYKF
jgi:hypothetical protein